MPKLVSRLTLKITGIRVERLQDISEEDARAEGVETDEFVERLEWAYNTAPNDIPCTFPSLRSEFRDLWESINGPDSWDANPWTWVIEFEVMRQNVNELMELQA